MIGYEELTALTPFESMEEREAFFQENEIAVDDLIKIGGEYALGWLQDIPEGAMITAQDLHLALKSLFLIGFELAWRIKDET